MPAAVLYVWDADYPWDVRTEKICRALTERGHDVHLAARNTRRRPELEVLPEGTVHRLAPLEPLPAPVAALTGFPAFFNPRWHRLIRSAIRQSKARVVIVRDLPLCPAAISVARRAGIPVILDMAENYPAMIRAIWDSGTHGACDVLVRNPRLVELVERWCLPRVDRILAVVEESADRLVRLGVAANRIALVSNTPSRSRAEGPERTYRSLGPADALEVVYLGLMELARGVGELLEAAALLVQKGTRVRVTLIGDGRDRARFEHQAHVLGLDGVHARFLGLVPNAEALALVAEADVGIVPHRADEAWNTTIPNKLFDYMAAGLPVVSSDTVPCRRIVETTGAGVVYPSGDAAGLAQALEGLRDPGTRQRYGTAGRAAIRTSLHWERSVEALDRCLASVTEAAGASAKNSNE
jgi:glycosyltransferase involved in cell wall biosynthesis